MEIIKCPKCDTNLRLQKNRNGKLLGTIVGGGIGFGVSSTLGIAGAVVGLTVAAPATIAGVIIFAVIGNRFGNDVDRKKVTCANCRVELKLKL